MINHSRKEFAVPALAELRDELLRVASAESRSPKRRRIPRVAVALTALTLVAGSVGAALMVWPRSDSSERETGENVGGSVGHGRSSYKSVRELVEKSDLIGVGTVAKSYIGKVYADDPTGQYPTRDLHTIVNLEEILKGSANSDQVTIVTLELAFAGPNQPDWRQPGERVLLFLTSSKETPDFFTLSNYFQTAYLIVGDDVRRAIAGDTSGVAGSIAGMSLSEVRQTARDSR